MERKNKRKGIGISSLVLLVIYLFTDSRTSVEIASWSGVSSVAHFFFWFWIAASTWVKIRMILDRQNPRVNGISIALFIFAFIFTITVLVVDGWQESDIGSFALIVSFVFYIGWPIVDGYDLALSPGSKK